MSAIFQSAESELSTVLSALRVEIESARALLSAQRACEDAIRRAAPAEELQALLSIHEQQLEAAKAAAAERSLHLAGPEAVERWLAGPRSAQSELLRASVVEARRLRDEIGVSARRIGYVARRNAEWCNARRQDLATIAVRAVSAEGGYGALGAVGAPKAERRFAWKVDRAA